MKIKIKTRKIKTYYRIERDGVVRRFRTKEEALRYMDTSYTDNNIDRWFRELDEGKRNLFTLIAQEHGNYMITKETVYENSD